jgi:DNA-directed RNA polymerase specialized sigma24 family protein
VSPTTLRRYRAERLLRQEFVGLRQEVLRSVRARLRARRVHLDGGDLEACYAQAWNGLYAAVAAGEEIANPRGWLAIVTFRRALDEHRSARARAERERALSGVALGAEPVCRSPERAGREDERSSPGRRRGSPARATSNPDLAAELDDRTMLRQLFEALRGHLSRRECEAASLCYLQGLTRAQAAQRMGISEARMAKLMEGAGAGRPGVAGKVGELLEAIDGGRWCEQQDSLMRGFAFGILDPRGERYRLARLHQRECPACRAYVLSLRGLAAVLPPLPLPRSVSTPPAPSAHATGAKAAGAKTGAGGAGASAGAGGTLATSGAAGAAGAGGAAGGGWLLGGSMGAKLAVGCLLALGVGCVAITAAPRRDGVAHRHRGVSDESSYLASAPGALSGSQSLSSSAAAVGRSSSTARGAAPDRSPTTRAAAARRSAELRAQREFGPEQPPAASSSVAGVPARSVPAIARAASTQGDGLARRPPAAELTADSRAASTQSGSPSRAEREFGPE